MIRRGRRRTKKSSKGKVFIVCLCVVCILCGYLSVYQHYLSSILYIRECSQTAAYKKFEQKEEHTAAYKKFEQKEEHTKKERYFDGSNLYSILKLGIFAGKILTAGDGYMAYSNCCTSSSDDKSTSNENLRLSMLCSV